MKTNRRHIFFTLFLLGYVCFSQQTVDRMPNANDISNTPKIFKEHFFDALSDRSVGKHEKAIKNINACLEIRNKIPVLYYELAQNEIALRFYKSAKENLNRALEINPNSEEVLKSLSGVHFKLEEFDKRILILQRMSEINPKYKYNLASAYRYTQQYDKALRVLRDYQKVYSYDRRIDSLRNQLYRVTKNKQLIIEDIEILLANNSNNENAYVQLINIYKNDKQKDKVIATIKRFQKAMPKAKMLEYVNFQQLIDQGDLEGATQSMRKMTKSSDFSQQVKSQVLNDFNEYYKKQSRTNQNTLDSIAPETADSTIAVHKDLKYIMELPSVTIKEGTTESLLEVYQSNLASDVNNYNLIKNTLVLQLYFGKWDKAKTLVEATIKKYPSQPFLYLIKGKVLTKQDKPIEAINNFKEGLEYIVDDASMERALYLNLAKAHVANGDIEKAKIYQDKGDKIETAN